MIQCRFSEFLIQVCMKNAFFGVPCRNITTMCRNIAFIEFRAEILLTWDQGVPGFSFRAIFLKRNIYFSWAPVSGIMMATAYDNIEE